MALPVSSVSEVCVHIRDFLKTEMAAAANNIDIKIGIPADAASMSNNGINLFFYRFDTSGFDAALRPDEIWRIRMYCLITTFGKDDDAENISAGENDLRMLGNIMRIFHENPVHQIDIDGLISHLQVIFLPLSDDQLNQVWSTQGETTYRPSVVYEMSLAPVVAAGTVWGGAPIVGALGTQLHADMSARHARFSGVTAASPVVKSTVNIADPAWTPKICFIYQNQCVQSLSFDVESTEFSSFTPQVWVAGDNSESVSLVWEVWKNGWSKAGSTVTVTPFNTDIDPDKIPSSVPAVFPFNISLPSSLTLAADEFSGQALLYATRSYTPIEGQAAIEIKSNPLLVSVYRHRP